MNTSPAFKVSSVALCAALMVSACGGSSDPTVSGTFLDAAVEGLDYQANASMKGATSAAGGFTCLPGDTVSFKLGGQVLGSAPCASVITPLNLAGGTDIKADKVVNRLLALQSLDEDGDPSNGIKISAAVKAAIAAGTFDFNADATTFNAALTGALAALPDAYKARVVDDTKRVLAREHFEDTLASKTGSPVAESFSQSKGAGTVTFTVTRYNVQAGAEFFISYEGSDPKIAADFPKGFLPAYGSGLAHKATLADGTMEFYAITDRGPNGDGPKVPNPSGSPLCYSASATTCESKIFGAPSFAPSIGVISVGKSGAVLKSSMPIKVSASVKATGLPNSVGRLGASGEAPVGDSLKYDATTAVKYSDVGLDTESIVVDKARNVLWSSDEYGPFIVKIDPATGIILKKYGPVTPAGVTVPEGVTAVLPTVLSKRRANRGMEGLALDVVSGKLHGFLQSPISDYGVDGKSAKTAYSTTATPGCTVSGSQDIEKFARFARWVEFDPTTETSKMYAYPINCADYDKFRTGNAKLGDMVSLGGGKFIVIEQGAGIVWAKVFNRLMLVELGTATDISAVAFNPTTSDLEKSSMQGAAVNGADYSSVVTLKKTLLLDLNEAGWLAEKAEGLALVGDDTLALVNDDDFGLRTGVYDAAGAAIAGADITACTSTAGVLSGCGLGTSSRVTKGLESERLNRLWLFKFSKKLADFSAPAP